VPTALRVVEITQDQVDFYKVAQCFLPPSGPGGGRGRSRGKKVFLDLQFHDIPNTVSGQFRGGGDGCHMLTVHCARGVEMMRGSAQRCRDWSAPAPAA